MPTTAETAKVIRTEIRAAVKAGTIPLPEGVKVSVRSDQYSVGASIDVTITAAPREWAWVDDSDRWGVPSATLSPAARAVGKQMAGIIARHVTYQSGSVSIDSAMAGSVAAASWRPGQD